MKTCSAFPSLTPCPSPLRFLIFKMVRIWSRPLLHSHKQDRPRYDGKVRGASLQSPFFFEMIQKTNSR